MIYYKIRNKETGLYVKGTPYYLKYDKTGRIFQNLGKLRAFLTGVMNRQYGRQVNFSDWEIVELEIVELEMVVKEIKSVNDVVDPKKLIQILAR